MPRGASRSPHVTARHRSRYMWRAVFEDTFHCAQVRDRTARAQHTKTTVKSAGSLAFAVVLSVLSGCKDAPTESVLQVIPIDVRQAPVVATVGTLSVHLTPYVWRDFMPGTTPTGQAMIASLSVESIDGQPLRDPPLIEELWVISGDSAWYSARLGELTITATSVTVVARNGPNWATGIPIDVVVRLRDTDGRRTYLRARDQRIMMTS